MQRALPALVKNMARTNKVLRPQNYNYKFPTFSHSDGSTCDVFINHRSIDTKKTVAGLLYYDLLRFSLRPFLDSKNMRPGDGLYSKIDAGIRSCKVGVAVFSPRYCESKFCLHELALLMESGKRVIPIFCDVKPSELRVTNLVNGSCSESDLERYKAALEEAKFTVGITFDCINGDWSEFLQSTSDAIIENLIEVEEENKADNCTMDHVVPNDTPKDL